MLETILILGDSLSYACLERIRQLLCIKTIVLALALQAILLSAVCFSSSAQSDSLQVTVTEVRRIKTDEVEFHITLKNVANYDLYLPTYGIGEHINIKTLWVYQWDADKGWRALGSSSELPPSTAMPLGPRQNYTLVFRIQDPVVTPRQGEGIPVFKGEPVALRGRHKIVVGYYRSLEEWQAYREYVQGISGKAARGKKQGSPPKLRIADSDEFEIATTKP
jgi:hypothetical protein